MTLGLIGEHIAAAAILSLNWRVAMAQQTAIDLVAFQDETILRIQVKASNPCLPTRRRSPSCHFQLGHGCKAKHLPTKDDYDVLCLVSPNARRVLFMPVTSVRQYSMRLPASRFTEDAENDSWDKAVDHVLEMRR